MCVCSLNICAWESVVLGSGLCSPTPHIRRIAQTKTKNKMCVEIIVTVLLIDKQNLDLNGIHSGHKGLKYTQKKNF